MWKIFKNLPRALRQQYNGSARSTPVGTISAEEEEASRLQDYINPKTPVIYTAVPELHHGSSARKDNRSPGGDQEWKRTFKNYCDFTNRVYWLESLSLGTAIALGVNLVNYHQILANCNSNDPEVQSKKRSSLLCLLRVAFSMPMTSRHMLPEKQDNETNNTDEEHEQRKAVARKAFEEACDSFMTLVDTYTGTSKNVSGIDKTRNGYHRDAVRDWQEASTLGYSKADYNLGISYEHGRGEKKNLAKAAQHYRLAAQAGHTKAQYNLAMMIMSGKCDVADISYSAEELLQLAASKGLSKAQTYLGVLYATDKYQDYDKAVSMFEAAADQKDANAQYQLAICYEKGLGVEQNECKAAELFSKAARAGHSKAMYNLGVFYENGLGGLPEDTTSAKELYRQSADKGVANAKYNLRRLEAIDAVNKLSVRETTSVFKMKTTEELVRKDSMHTSQSSPNLMLLSKPDINMNNTATELADDQKLKKKTIKFSLGGEERSFGNKFDLNFGNFGTGMFGSFVVPRSELATSTCSLEEVSVGRRPMENQCVAF